MSDETRQKAQLESAFARFTLSAADNTWSLEDVRAGVDWGNRQRPGPWVEIRRTTGPDAERFPLTLDAVTAVDDGLRGRFVDAAGEDGNLDLVFRLVDDGLQVYVMPDADLGYASIDLFRSGLDAGSEDDGEALVPIRMGLLLPARSDKDMDLSLGTYAYEGAHASMAGLFKSGAVLMADWGDPYVTLNVTRTVDGPDAILSIGFSLIKTARSLELRCLGEGDLATLADAYRDRATALGYRVPWAEKLRDRPQAARLFGTCNVKLWHALARRIDEDLVEQSVEQLDL
jgi:hypothetical protein